MSLPSDLPKSFGRALKSAPLIHLASGSKERKLILEELGFEVEAEAVNADETPLPTETAQQLVSRLSLLKMDLCLSDHWTVTADTVVQLDERTLGKPLSREQASDMLMSMSGRELLVWTGQAVRSPSGHIEQQTFMSKLSMAPWTEKSLSDYLDSNLWLGRAGGFNVSDPSCPVTITSGHIDVVRGLHGYYLKSCLNIK